MTTDTPPNREQLRQQVRQLLAEGASNREIARRLPVGKDTVRRWRTELDAPTPPDAPPGAPAAPSARATLAEPEPPRTDQVVLDVDGDLGEDLAVLAEGGLTTQDAIACSLRLIAEAVRSAWDYGICPRGLLPTIQPRTSHPAAALDAPSPTAPGMTLIRSTHH